MTKEYSLINIQDEVLNKVRAYLNFTDPNNRVTEKQFTATGDGSTKLYRLSKNSLSYVKNVFVDSQKLFYDDWKIYYRDGLSDTLGAKIGSIEFNSAPANASDIAITWGDQTGDGEYVYDKFSDLDLDRNAYPRIGLEFSVNSSPRGAGSGKDYALSHNILLQVQVVHTSKMRLKQICEEIENFFKKNMKNFSTFKTIVPSTINSSDNFREDAETSFFKIMNFEINDRREIIAFGDRI